MTCYPINQEGKYPSMTSEREYPNAGSISGESEQYVISPYVGRESVERMMTRMMQEMSQGAERAVQCRMQGETEMKIRMGCETDGDTAADKTEA